MSNSSVLLVSTGPDGDQGGEAVLGAQARDGLPARELARRHPPDAQRRPGDAHRRGEQGIEGVIDHYRDRNLVGLGQRYRVNGRPVHGAGRRLRRPR